MPAPDYYVEIGDRASANGAVVDTGVAFLAGRTERGPSDAPVASRSFPEWVTNHGDRLTADPTLYDTVEAMFHEGQRVIYTGRVVGDTPVKATADVLGAAAAVVGTATALTPGEWGNDLDLVADASGATFTLAVVYKGATVESSPIFSTWAEAIAWAESSAYLRLANGTGADPVDGTTSLAGGDEDSDAIDDDTWQSALDLFTIDLGGGQVCAPGRTSTVGAGQVLVHAAFNKRVGLVDLPDSPTVSTVTTASLAQRTTEGARLSGAFWPWLTIPGLTPGTTRTIPPSGVVAALMARSDGLGQNPNQAAAGMNGRCRYVIGLSQDPKTADERDTLNQAGANVFRVMHGEVRLMGDRTLTNPLTDANWVPLSNSRLVCAVASRAGAVLEGFEFRQVDGRDHALGELQGKISGQACKPFYDVGALYGRTPAEAFTVNTLDVNPPSELQAGRLHAQIALRVSPRAEVIILEIVKVPITEAL
jgi:hypothetical protein